jgi:hypothetical protein
MALINWSIQKPPLVDLQHPERPLAKSIKEKRDLLVRELLTNIVEAGDISSTAPSVAARNIDFPPITIEDVQKSILGAGNTAPGADEVPTAILKVAWP